MHYNILFLHKQNIENMLINVIKQNSIQTPNGMFLGMAE